jgi:hypothetical protein
MALLVERNVHDCTKNDDVMVLATARLFSDKGAYGQRAAGEIE